MRFAGRNLPFLSDNRIVHQDASHTYEGNEDECATQFHPANSKLKILNWQRVQTRRELPILARGGGWRSMGQDSASRVLFSPLVCDFLQRNTIFGPSQALRRMDYLKLGLSPRTL
jgi:hypothetical protein